MKGKAVIPLVLGLCLGLIAVKFGINAIRNAQANQKTEKIPALMAVQDIDIGQAITEDFVQLVETEPNDFLPSVERIDSLDLAVGRVAAKPIPTGSPVLQSMLAPEGTSPELVGQIPAGYRAVSVYVDEVTSVAYQLKRGDWVDVMVVMDITNSRSGHRTTVAEVILQHVQVAAVGRSMRTMDDGKKQTAKSVTLFVPEEEAPKLHLAATRGSITLAMRGDEPEDAAATMPSASIEELIKSVKQGPSPLEEHLKKSQQKQEEEKKPEMPSGMLSALLAKSQEPAAEDQPYKTMIYRGRAGQLLAMEQVTFENKTSRTIMDVSDGPTVAPTLSRFTNQNESGRNKRQNRLPRSLASKILREKLQDDAGDDDSGSQFSENGE